MKWTEQLRKLLQEASRAGGRVVFVGIGNPLRGDDGIGVRIAEVLMNSIKCDRAKVVIVEDRVDILDRFLGDLKPSLLIFFDAVDFGGEPGEIRIFDSAEASGKAISTHLIPLNIILEAAEITSPSYILGIQVKSLEFGEEISEPVKKAGEMILEFLQKELLIW